MGLKILISGNSFNDNILLKLFSDLRIEVLSLILYYPT